MNLRALSLGLIIGIGTFGCAKEKELFELTEDTENDINSENNEDTNADTNSDSDTNTDSNNNSDTESIRDTNKGSSDAGTDTDSKADLDAGSISETDTDSDAGTDAHADTGTDSDTSTDIDSNTDTESKIDPGTDMDSNDTTATETDTGGGIDTSPDTYPDTDTDTNSDTISDINTDYATDMGSETESETDAESCFDGEKNQDETGIDCGGETCPPCPCEHYEYSSPEQVTIQGINGNIYSPTFSEDGLTMYVSRYLGYDAEIYVAVRESRDTLQFTATKVTGITASASYDRDGTPFLSADELTLYFQSQRSGGMGGRDIMMATRADLSSEFSNPTFMTDVNSDAHEHQPWLSDDNLTMFFLSTRSDPEFSGDDDNVWYATRESSDASFGEAQFLYSINTDADEGRVALTKDLLTIYFDTNGRDSMGQTDIFVATRKDINSDFEDIENLTDSFNSAAHDRDVTLTSDGTELYFSSERSGDARIWRSIRTCADTEAY